MKRWQLVRNTGILLIFLVVLSNIPYILLIQTFEYDDILRQPVDYVLTQFHAGGARLILTWFTFGLAALLFIPASIMLHLALAREDKIYLPIATFMGAMSGILQALGLMRWVFVVPVLANLYTNTNASTATKEAVSVVYQAVHQYGGVLIGEHLGQTLLIGWTLGVGIAMRSSPLFKSWVAWWGLLTTPLLLLGQSELISTVIPSIPVIEATPVGFILWEVWLLIIGISLLRVPKKRLLNQTEKI
ncbi:MULTISPECIES: DUF4386 domain-containing protein [unclassified Tolypothrix]|uniref:DUF4386 domain-containing protein n=1 Tax=unclassified Tolypothrix TaxID=2649714 RepID=UPI0005EAB849|nr:MULTISPECIES: DUF4386 domain-containing protein [unclassified Tolypothrix]BAY93341.1 hypothetical protein NIES3275_53800 [Microchaete diplosiphon NIES-3275]EKF00113.1 hypothetical protein FDUTEX481_09321 [Tolypothrix sp. PCC 7601]MBE9083947.1 DUF4386 domain-containing protein [Tolypothrix sp. LEGE 11397]UYD27194.1 DUF4386 domain-containing protein [Tolypothrix sp. PCC 7712]UYD36945.1 DUF4386 domain-containing protein [Tolypothrix sp. PCC 7601]